MGKTRRPKIPVILLGAIFICMLLSTLSQQDVIADNLIQAGTTIKVTTITDELNTDGDCSLREAIRAANTNLPVDACPAGSGADTIILQPVTYKLTKTGTDEDLAISGDLDIYDDLLVVGVSVTSTIVDGNATDRIFHVYSPDKDNLITVKFTNLTLRNGFAPATNFFGGGAILNGNVEQEAGTIQVINCLITMNKAQNIGGGIDNSGEATLIEVSLVSNQASAGGGIFNDGLLTIADTTLSQNIATNTGGGLDNNNSANLYNVTISANTGGKGGGIFSDGRMYILNTTIANNNTGLVNNGDLRVKNSIITDSTTGANCTIEDPEADITSLGNNLENTNTCGFNQLSDQINTDPDLGPLQNNLGPTLTHALMEGSPAIDTGDNYSCPLQDQRGAYRPADGDENGSKICDIGAYEYAGAFPNYSYLPMLSRH